jgi:natural product biosynthesis luciferase-like monooxygenase protein/amino acid adenylation domain-containing protein/non-ribosomal peptide synthase protein (TIGR01720 family)/FkbM family methyltransferase
VIDSSVQFQSPATSGLVGFRLSPQQRHVWELLRSGSGRALRVSCAVAIEGDLDGGLLRAAVEAAVERHEILRTLFQCLPGLREPLQVIAAGGGVRWFEHDLTGLGEAVRDEVLEPFLSGGEAAFDLEHGPLLEASLVRFGPARHALVLALPALCCDAAGLLSLVAAIRRGYAAMLRREPLTGEVVQYADVSEIFNHLLESEETEEGRAHWSRAGLAAPAVHLPLESAVPAGGEWIPRIVRTPLDAGLLEHIEALAAVRGVAAETVILAAWWVLLRRLSGEPALSVANVFSGRTYDELESAVGLLARAVPLQAAFDIESPFALALGSIGEALRVAEGLQDYFSWEAAGGGSGAQFPQIVFEVMENPVLEQEAGPAFSVLGQRGWSERFKLCLRWMKARGELEIACDAGIIEAAALLPERLLELLGAAVAAPHRPCAELPLTGPEERRSLLASAHGADAALGYEGESCLHRLVEAQARRSPERIAVVAEEGELTYAELDARANRLASYLLRLGARRGDRAAVCLERGLDLVSALLGVLKAGCAYLPLDVAHPRERLGLMLEESGARLVVATSRLAAALPATAAEAVEIDGAWQEGGWLAGEPAVSPAVPVTPGDLAYVIYTSGSSGRPKGVMVPHGAIANRLLWMQREFPLGATDRVLQKTPFSFDASIWELFVPLLAGARLVMARPGGHQEPSYLVDAVIEHGVTTLQLVPSLLRPFLDERRAVECRSLTRLYCGGEALPMDQVERALTLLPAALCNLYGPTESAIDATFWPCSSGPGSAVAPIGRPLANIRVYLLDARLQPVPAGMPGELWIGGAGLAWGYLGRPDLTAERFLPDPWSGRPGERLYRSGDLVRSARADGAIEYLGRVDHQVKIRGFRIELGEIEAVLAAYPGVRAAAVIAREAPAGDRRLVAYAVPAGGEPAAAPPGPVHRLPNGLEVLEISRAETDLIYREIFEEEVYLQHGVTLFPGDCVVDVGANIGLFTLFAERRAPGAQVYSFEPVPPVFAKLRDNVAWNGAGARVFNAGLSSRSGAAEITFYPQWSGMSGLYADAREDEEITRAFLRNQDARLAEHADELLAGRFEGQVFRCVLKTLSEVIRESSIERIDLLKVDVEKAELDVLRGIAEADWPRIGQIVIEAHDRHGNLQEIRDLLAAHGFRIAVDDSGLLEGTGMVNLYAVSPAWEERRRRPGPGAVADAPPAAAARAAVTPATLRAYAAERLPDYMVPSLVVLLPSLPLLPSGKVDRNALPEPEPAHAGRGRERIGPGTPTEELLTALWEQVLGLTELDVRDNFFDAGGHSLLATQLVSRIREVFSVELRVRSLFEAPSVAELAIEVDAARTARLGVAVPPVVPVPRAPGEAVPLSFAQQRLWFLDQLGEGSHAYNLPAALRLSGPLSVPALRQALAAVMRRHAVLRTTFPSAGGAPVQMIGPPAPFAVPVADLRLLGADRREAELRRLALADARAPFDLAHGPLLRAGLVWLAEMEHVLLLNMHHIVGDGWSTGVLIRELGALYAGFAAGRPARLPDLPVQYADFAVWQRQWLSGPVLEKQLSALRGRLAGLEPLDLPTDRPRPPVQTFRGARHSFRLPRLLSEALRALGRRDGASLFMVLLAAFSALLQRYSGQSGISVGTPIAARNRREIEGLIGLFINTLVLYTDLSGDPSFQELLARTRETALGAYAHEDLPFEKLVDELQPERDLARSPLFQVMLILQNVPLGAPELPGLRVEMLPVESSAAKFDLTLEMAETAQGLHGSLEYSTDLFEPATMVRLAGHLATLLEAAAAAPEEHILDLPVLTAGERSQVIEDWNATAEEYPAGATLPGLFQARAALHPEAAAVLCGGERLTYGELAGRAGLLSAYLRGLGAGPGSIVALSMERSLDMVVGILGILGTGAAYLPLDPAYPAARLAFMLEDSGAAVLLTQERLSGRFPAQERATALLDADWPAIAAAGNLGAGVPAACLPDDLAYVIYTSGSTGRPKGVMVSHRNVVSFFTGMDHRLGCDPGCWLALTSISFDISVLELLWTLTRGFQVVVHGEGQPLVDGGARPTAVVRDLQLSLFYFANEEEGGRADRYRLLLEGARFADRHGFAAVWTPERHFHAFGGLYPSPAVTSAALAAVTERIQIRAGSVVLPLHHPVRVAEEWAMIDNLSHGRVGISFASGWHADDFLLAPENYARRKEKMIEGIDTVRRLWRGEVVRARGGTGQEIEVRTLPRPVQAELPVWITAAGNIETFRLAGELGCGVLTHLLGQDLDDLGEKIAAYRQSWREHGHGPGDGHVTLMLHAFVGEDEASVRETVRRPFCNYLRTSLDLVRNLSRSLGREVDPAALSAQDLDDLLERSFERYVSTSALLGTEETCLRLLEQLAYLGVDEAACLIDFGVDEDAVLASLPHLESLRRRVSDRLAAAADLGLTVAAEIERFKVTHLQCTPTAARLLAADAEARRGLASLRRLLLGGEALPLALAGQLDGLVGGEIHNMYGPTETAIWSSTWQLSPGAQRISIGRPIANTESYVLDRRLRPLPAGVPGELLIGGLGVARGYLGRPELTAERFVPSPFGSRPGARLYRTGDLARWRADGELEFLGRLDHQVKVHGHRIELEEIERALERHPGVAQAVVTASEDRLVAYFVAADGGSPAVEAWEGRYHRLPNGLRVACMNDFQANQAFREIFEGAVYLRHGITLEDGDCVFDVGANIGFFSLFASQRCQGLEIYAFEPIPVTFRALSTNVSLHAVPAELFLLGLGEHAETARFTFYPQMPGLSGRYSDPEKDRSVNRALLLAGLEREGGALSERDIDDLLDEQFHSETFECSVRSLSDVIDERGIERIDLLKIDVERAELDVLRGIRGEHWARVRQITMETDGRENLDGVVELLRRQGFEVFVEPFMTIPANEASAEPMEIFMLYARRHGGRDAARPRAGRPASASLSLSGLRAHLRQSLPDSMIPQAFVRLEAMPLTPNGKVARKALAVPAGEHLGSEKGFAAPHTRVEKILAEIWEQLLRVERIGVHDNFFERGGDSILSIQMISRAHQAGLRLTPRQLFQHQTISELATVAGLVDAPAAAREVAGPVPLTPIQRWFFEQDLPHPHHYNHAVLLETRADVDPYLLGRAFASLLAHHDGLRLRFTRGTDGWRQENAPAGGPAPFAQVDLSALPGADRLRAVAAASAAAQASLDLGRGPLLRALAFPRGAGEPGRLLLILHHLVVDGISWRILLEDLQAAYGDLAAGQPVRLASKTTSFQRWAEHLVAQAGRPQVQAELGFWLSQLRGRIAPLPVDDPGGANTEGSARTVAVWLDAEETRALLQRVPAVYNTRIDDLLLAALVQGFTGWTGAPALLVDLEGHGREEVGEYLDVSRTTGWFSTFSPLLLNLKGAAGPGEAIKAVKEQLRRVPARGIGYSLLRYLGGDGEASRRLRALPQPEVSFNYLGQFDQVLAAEAYFRPVGEPAGEARDARQLRRYLLDVSGDISGGRLRLLWTYPAARLAEATVQRLAGACVQALRELIEHCLAPEAGGYTPSDFPLAALSQEALDRLAGPAGDIEDLLPLSPLQQGLLFHILEMPRSAVYLLQYSCALDGDLDTAAFGEAWQRVVGRHSILRTGFFWEGLEEPVQRVQRSAVLPIEWQDWRALPENERRRRFEAFLAEDRRCQFDLSRVPLMRISVVRLGEREHRLVWTYHHLLLDAWSAAMVVGEVFAHYTALRSGRQAHLERPRSYGDYIAWLRRQDFGEAEAFWRRTLAGLTAPTPLGIGRSGPRERGDAAAQPAEQEQESVEMALSVSLSLELRAQARRHRLTLNTLAVGAWAFLLGYYSGSEDVVTGVISSGREVDLPGIGSMVGVFINTLPLRVRLELSAAFGAWLAEVQDRQVQTRRFEHSPLVQVQQWSEVERGLPLFESIFVFESYPAGPAAGLPESGLSVRGVRSQARTSYPLSFVATPADEITLHVIYDPGRFDAVSAERLLGHLRSLLAAFVESPAALLGDLSPLSAAERLELLAPGMPEPAADADLGLHDLFAMQARRTPQAVAVSWEGRDLSYAELDQRSNRLARYLKTRGAGPGRLVALCLERSADMAVAILAVLKTGAAFLPLDPAQPPERTAFMLADAAAALVVTQRALRAGLPDCAAPVVSLDSEAEAIDRLGGDRLKRESSPAGLAYTIYTSGSTGRPKGVLITHRNVVRLFSASQGRFGFGPDDVWTLFHSYAFDFSVWELWGALLHGGRLVVVPFLVSRSPEDFYRLLVREKVTVLNQTPSAFRRLDEVDAEHPARLALRWVIFGGEALAPAALAGWFGRHGDEQPRLVNMYGITETTVHVTFRLLSTLDARRSSSPIGEPLPDLHLRLLNGWLQPVPAGAAGELCVGGPGLGLGYLGRPGLTAERFVPNPFADAPGGRLYRSGDLARRLPGEVEYLGRSDHQVKIRGFRIELGEIETALRRLPGVRDAVVVTRGEGEHLRLVAYLAAGPDAVPPGAIQEALRQELPEYMVPASYVPLAALPLTANGKVDRGALPAPEASPSGMAVPLAAPRNAVEDLIASAWAEVLGLPHVGLHDNFLDLGGHSLLATRLVSRMRQQFAVEIPLGALFEHPTVAGLAAAVQETLRGGPAAGAPPILPVPRGADLPLSFSQQRLWFLDRWQPGTALFNVPLVLDLTGRLEPDVLAATLSAIVARHEALRTTFPERRGEPVQAVAAPAAWALPRIDLRALPSAAGEREALRIAAGESRRPFDLARGPLMRSLLVDLGEERSRLLATLHHIVCDGWSMGILVREVSVLYGALVAGREPRLPALPVQYADFAVWQRSWLRGEVLQEHLAYWQRRLAGAPTTPQLPTDHPRPESPSYRGGLLPLSLSAELTAELRALSRRFGVTLFMTAVAAFQVLLRRVVGHDDIVVGTDVANRGRLEIEGLVGFFVNQLALRTDLSGDPAVGEILRRVREAALGAYVHQDLPFERLVEALKLERSLSYSPLFQVKIFFLDPQEESLDLPGLAVRRIHTETGTAKLDLILALQETSQGLRGSLEYDSKLFEPATAERLAAGLQACLAALVEHSEARLAELKFPLQPMERNQMTMEKSGHRPASFDRLKSIKPKSVTLPRGELVRRSYLAPGQMLPLVVEPAVPEVDAAEWSKTHRDEVARDLLQHGAILFRGFGLGTTEAFERFAGSICSELFNENGEHPRESVSGNVYTPVFYPPDQKLLWHNENSFNLRWPMKILFACSRPADQGGETPLVDSRRVFAELDPEVRQKFVDRQVAYQRNFGAGVGLDWQTVFQTTEREDLERRARAEVIELEWKDGERLRTRSIRPAVARHPVTGEWTWFNQAQHWHVSCLDPETRRSMEALFAEGDLPRNCYYGDGTPIADADMQHILDVYSRLEVSFPWQPGDAMVIDNMLVAHARNPFAGERRILVALGDMGEFLEIP